LRGLHGEYGAVAAFGYKPYRYVALFGPAANRYVLAEHPETFLWRDALASLIAVNGETALVVSDGDEHARRRRLVQPAFATRQIRQYFDIMVNEINRELDDWTEGRHLDVFVAFRRVVRRIAVRSLFGDTLGARADELGRVLGAAIDFVNLPITAQIKVDLPWTRWHRAKAARDHADRIVNAEIARRHNAPSRGVFDALDSLLDARDDSGTRLTDVEIRDQVVSLVAAGYDTTSAAAAWAVHELLNSNTAWDLAAVEVRDVVGAECLTTERLARLPYLDAVVNETLRLWPPAWVSARRTIDTFEFAGAKIPAGSTVLYSPYVTHRMPDVWPEPDHFRPERWAGLEPEPYSYVPFGGGYRRCLGFAFAIQELKVVLVELLRRVTLERIAGPVTPIGTAALHPKEGVPVVVRDVATR
jgi:cytochrome P450